MSDSEIQSLTLDNKKTWPGLSGGFLKVLLSTVRDTALQTMEQWIVKFGDADRPTIVIIEFFGMRLAKAFGLDVPQVVLAGEASRLMVRRFDLTAEGDPLAFEDMCALQEANAADKFSSSAESVVKTIERFCSPDTRASSLEAFFCQYLLAAVIRNGDAHLKNFGLLHGDNWLAALSPVYDMLSMAVYAPRTSNGDAYDGMALTLAGARRWPTSDAIAQLGVRCAVPLQQQAHWRDRLRHALMGVGTDVVEFSTQAPRSISSRRALKRMLELWSHGAALLDTKTQCEMMKLAVSIRID
ncbi:HipA domain-containing protein [Achromobacter sp. NPDC058515]|uniref:HipA domain-containing protein n=1 Tax=Achromobacter sp. NPDC058515 TaxID=3346533 RepID=UPI00364CAAFA